MRKALFVVHLWVGLSLGLLASLIGLTGSLLVFRHEIDAALAPNLLRVSPSPNRVSAGQMVANVLATYPQTKIQHVMLPAEETAAVEVWTKGAPMRVYVNPYSGEVLGDRDGDATLMGRLFHLHTELLAGENGKTVAGIAGIGLVILCLSGIVVWWPRKTQRVRDHLRVKWGAGTKRVTYDLHRAGGFFASGLLLMVAVMGVALVFPDSARLVAFRLAGQGEPPPKPKAAKAPSRPLDDLVAAADAALSGGRVMRLSLPAKPGDPLVVRKKLPGELHPNGVNYVFVDPSTARVLRIDLDSGGHGGQRAMNLRYPLHIGIWAGTASRMLHVLLGLMPGFLMVTGLMMWWRRVRRKTSARRASRSEPAYRDPATSPGRTGPA